MTNYKQRVHKAANLYRQAGLSVIPIALGGRKQPYAALLPPDASGKPSWSPFAERLPTDVEMADMFSGKVPMGVAIVCGVVSGGLEIIDFDDGRTWQQFRQRMEQDCPGLLQRLPQVCSPREGGGRHLYLFSDCPGPSCALARDADGNKLIEVKGRSGYCLAPGSDPRCHATEQPYRHAKGTPAITSRPQISDRERRLLFSVATGLNQYIEEQTAKRSAERSERNANHDAPGNVFMARETFASSGLLQRHGWRVLGEHAGRTAWARPGRELDKPGFSALSGPDRYGHDRITIYSDQGGPLQEQHSYNLFQAFALLECQGKFDRAAMKLAEQGFVSDAEDKQPTATNPLLWRPFPTELLPGPCHEYIQAAAKGMHCDPALVALPLLGAMGGAVGYRRVQRFVGRLDWKQPCIIWAASIAPTGSAKTHGWRAGVKFLLELETKAYDHFQAQQKEYEQQLEEYRAATKRKDKSACKPEEPIRIRYRTQDATVEKLVDILQHRPQGVCMCWNELSGWFGTFDKYSGGKSDEPKWLEAWDGEAFVDDRIGAERYAKHAAVSIAGTIQPPVFKRTLTTAHYENGLVQRFLWAKPPLLPSRFVTQGVSDRLDAKMRSLFRKLTELEMDGNGDPVPVYVDAEGTTIYQRWQDQVAEEVAELSESDPLRSAYSKLNLYAVRFALLFHLIDTVSGRETCEQITAATVQRGIQLAEWFRLEVARLYMLMQPQEDQGPQLVELAEFLGQKDGWLSVREIKRGPRRYREIPGDDIEKLLQQLVEKNWVRVKERKRKSGPPVTLYRVVKQGTCHQQTRISRETSERVTVTSVSAAAETSANKQSEIKEVRF